MSFKLWKAGDVYLVVNATGRVELTLDDIRGIASMAMPVEKKTRKRWKIAPEKLAGARARAANAHAVFLAKRGNAHKEH